MFITLGYARSKLKAFIGSGSCQNSDIDNRINEVIDHLLREAGWKCSVRRVLFYECESVLTLPREFDKILFITYDNRPGLVFSQYYEFLEGGPGRIDDLANTTSSDLVDLGETYPIMKDIPEDDTWTIAAFSTEASDAALELTIKGTVEYNNNPLVDGSPYKNIPINRWDDGVEGVIKNMSTVQVSADEYKDIQQVIKPVTKGYVTLYAIDKTAGTATTDRVMYYLAKYHPDETVPSYRRYKIMLANVRDEDTDASVGNKIIAMVKLKFTPAVHENDILLIQDVQALKLGCMALARLEADEFKKYKALKDEAILLLHKQLADNSQQMNEINVQMTGFAIGSSPNVI